MTTVDTNTNCSTHLIYERACMKPKARTQKRERRKKKSFSKLNHYVTMHTRLTIGQRISRHFQRYHGRQRLAIGRCFTRYLKNMGIFHSLMLALHARNYFWFLNNILYLLKYQLVMSQLSIIIKKNQDEKYKNKIPRYQPNNFFKKF